MALRSFKKELLRIRILFFIFLLSAIGLLLHFIVALPQGGITIVWQDLPGIFGTGYSAFEVTLLVFFLLGTLLLFREWRHLKRLDTRADPHKDSGQDASHEVKSDDAGKP